MTVSIVTFYITKNNTNMTITAAKTSTSAIGTTITPNTNVTLALTIIALLIIHLKPQVSLLTLLF